MAKICPSCKSPNARRSSVRASEITLRHIFLSPYRCRTCRARFWVVSKNAFYFAGTLALAVVAGAVGWNAGGWLESPRGDQAKGTNDARYVAELVKLADDNDAVAEHELSRLYGGGFGVAKSAAEEHVWLRRSAEHGNVQAQYELGIALRDGHGTVQDYEEARKWLQRAAEGGNARAQFALGLVYRSGMGVPADNVKAYIWLNLAAAQEVPGAASARDTMLARLAAAELQEAQAEARRMSGIYITKTAPRP